MATTSLNPTLSKTGHLFSKNLSKVYCFGKSRIECPSVSNEIPDQPSERMSGVI